MKIKVKCPCCGKEHLVDVEVTVTQRMVKQPDGTYKEELDIVGIREVKE